MPLWRNEKIGLYLNPEAIAPANCIEKCISAPKIAPAATPNIPHHFEKNNIPIIIPILYKSGAKAYSRNRLKDLSIPPITLDAANITGFANRILIKITAFVNLLGSFLNPGAIILII